MLEGADLSLGTLFVGKVDETFLSAVNSLRSILQGLASSMTATASAASSSGMAAKKAGNEFSDFGKRISNVTGGFQRLSNAIKVVLSYGLASSFLFGFIRGMKSGVESIVEFDQALKNLQAITDSTDAEVSALRTAMLDIASSTKYSAQEISDAAIIIGQAGFTAGETMDILASVAALSTGTLSSMRDSSDLLTSALGAFQEKSIESARVADIFAVAMNKSKLDVDKLRTAFNYLGPVSHQVGLSLEEAAAATMLLSNAGLKGSTIGTGLRRVLQLLVDPSKKLRLLFSSAGADLDKLNPGVSSMKEIISELEKILGRTVPAAERARRAFELFGTRGANAAAVLAQSGAAAFEEMLNATYEVGAASKMAEKQMQGLGAMLSNLKSRAINLAIALGEGGIADAFRLLLPLLQSLVSGLTTLADSTIGRTIVAFAALTATLAGLRITAKYVFVQFAAMALGQTIEAVKALTVANGALSVSFTVVGEAAKKAWLFIGRHPFLIVTAAISAAVVAFYSYGRAKKETIPILEKEAVETNKVVEKLEAYRDKLNSVDENSLEYKSTIRRLVEEYPELSKAVDVATGKFRDQGRALDELLQKHKELRTQKLIDIFSSQREQLQGLTKEIEYIDRHVVPRQEGDILEKRFPVESSNRKKLELSELQREADRTIERIGQAFLDAGVVTTASLEQIKEKLKSVFDVKGYDLEKLTLGVKAYFDRVESLRKPVPEEALLSDQQGRLAEYEKTWLELYRRVGEAEQAEILETVAALEKKKEKVEEQAKAQGWTAGQLSARLEKMDEEAFRLFQERESAKERKARQTIQSITVERLKALGREEEAEKAIAYNRARDEEQRIKENEMNETQRILALRMNEEKLSRELINIRDEYKRKREALDSDILQRSLQASKKETEAAKEAAKETFRANEYKISRSDETGKKKDEQIARERKILQDTLVRIDLEAARKREDIENEVTLNTLEALGKKEEAEIKSSEMETIKKRRQIIDEIQDENRRVELLKMSEDNLQKDIERIHQKYRDKGAGTKKEKLLTLEEEYRLRKITIQEFYTELDRLAEANLISDRQRVEWKAKIQEKSFDAMKAGFDRSRAEMLSWSEFVYSIGEKVGDMLASNLTNGLMDFIEGTKNAKDAFVDFAKSTIKWITEMILKQQILNMLQSTKLGGVMGLGGSSLNPEYSMAGTGGELNFASGGWLREPILGRGLNTGKKYTLSEKEAELVVPKSKLGGAGSAPDVQIIVENKSGQQLKATQSQPRFDGERWVVTTLLSAVERNVGGIRSLFGG